MATTSILRVFPPRLRKASSNVGERIFPKRTATCPNERYCANVRVLPTSRFSDQSTQAYSSSKIVSEGCKLDMLTSGMMRKSTSPRSSASAGESIRGTISTQTAGASLWIRWMPLANFGDPPEGRCKFRFIIGADHAAASRKPQRFEHARVLRAPRQRRRIVIQRRAPEPGRPQARRLVELPRQILIVAGSRSGSRMERDAEHFRGRRRRHRRPVTHGRHTVEFEAPQCIERPPHAMVR